MKKTSKITMILIFLFCLSSPLHAGEVHLSAAASLTDALKEVISTYNSVHPETTILTNFGASGTLAKQAEQGAPTDVFISANQKWMNYLVEKNKIGQDQVRDFARNELVFIAPAGATTKSLSDITTLARIALGSPKNVPAGEYAAKAMEQAGIYKTLEEGNKLVMAKDVRQALLYADRGEVDGAFVYRTDAMLAETAKILFAVPTTEPINYPMAVTVTGQQNKEAMDFAAFLSGKEATEILTRFGFITTVQGK